MSERRTLAFSVLMNNSCRSHRWTDRERAARAPLARGRETECHRWSSSRRGSEGPFPPTGRRARWARSSMATSSGVASSSWTAQAAPRASGAARRAEATRPAVPARTLRRGKRPPLAGWPVATSPCRCPRAVRRRHGPARLGTRGELAPRRDLPTPASPAISPTTDPPGRDELRPLGEPSRAQGPNLRPVARPMSPFSRTRPDVTTRRLHYLLVARADRPRGRPHRGGCRSCALLGIWFNLPGRKQPLTRTFACRRSKRTHIPNTKYRILSGSGSRRRSRMLSSNTLFVQPSCPLRTAEDITNHHSRVPMTSPATIRPLTPLERPRPDRHCTGLHVPDPPLPRSNAGSSPHDPS